MKDWIEFLGSQYKNGGFLSKTRRGEFHGVQGEAFLDALDEMYFEEGMPIDVDLLRQFVARIWYVPMYMERHTERIARRGGDVWRYRELVANVSSAVHRTLSFPSQSPTSVGDGNAYRQGDVLDGTGTEDDRERFGAIVTSIFDNHLGGLGLLRARVLARLVRYESEVMFVNVRFRRCFDRPRLEIGRLFDIGGEVFGIADVLEALSGPDAARRIWTEATRKTTFEAFVAAQAELLISHCGELLRGDSSAFRRVSSFYSERNSAFAARVIECSGHWVRKRP